MATIIDKEVTSINVNDPFSMIYPGMVGQLSRNVFYPPRTKPPVDSMYVGVRAIHKDPTKCAHYAVTELSEGVEVKRCDRATDLTKGANGFLCPMHHIALAPKPSAVRFLSYDAQVILHILKEDALAIAQGEVEEVRLTVKGEKMRFLK